MKHTKYAMIVACATMMFLVGTRTAAQEGGKATHGIEGSWRGMLKVPGGSLNIIFNVTATMHGGHAATLDSPDQGVFGIKADSAFASDSVVWLSFSAIGGKLSGVCPPGADSLMGIWEQGGMTFPVVLYYSRAPIAAPKRPQEPSKPFPYREEEVTFRNKKAGITLAGTLSLPSTRGPYPAAILVTGSGPQDRNEEIFGHKPFLVISDYLVRQGIAVLRYDDRGVGKSGGKFAQATTRDFGEDATAALDFLRSKKEINKIKIGVIGHSEGGIIAPLVASQRKDIAFVVMLAGTGVTGEQVIVEQLGLLLRAAGVEQEVVKKRQEFQRNLIAVVISNVDSVTKASRLRSIILAAADTGKSANPQAQEMAVKTQIAQIMSPWFRYFLIYDPQPALRKVKCPVLLLNGEKDVQVSPKQNLPAIVSALREGGNTDVTVHEIPGLNHLFQLAKTGGPDEYGKIEETMSPEVLKIIGDWILEKAH
jgi:uncharacterized protein